MTMLVPWTAEELAAIAEHVAWYMGLVHPTLSCPATALWT